MTGDFGSPAVWRSFLVVLFCLFASHPDLNRTGVGWWIANGLFIEIRYQASVTPFNCACYCTFISNNSLFERLFYTLQWSKFKWWIQITYYGSSLAWGWFFHWQVLAGHEAPVPSLAFSPQAAVLVSASWDSTVKIWDIFDNKGHRETIQLSSDGGYDRSYRLLLSVCWLV